MSLSHGHGTLATAALVELLVLEGLRSVAMLYTPGKGFVDGPCDGAGYSEQREEGIVRNEAHLDD